MSCLYDACDLVPLREVLGELPLPLPWEIVAADMSRDKAGSGARRLSLPAVQRPLSPILRQAQLCAIGVAASLSESV